MILINEAEITTSTKGVRFIAHEAIRRLMNYAKKDPRRENDP